MYKCIAIGSFIVSLSMPCVYAAASSSSSVVAFSSTHMQDATDAQDYMQQLADIATEIKKIQHERDVYCHQLFESRPVTEHVYSAVAAFCCVCPTITTCAAYTVADQYGYACCNLECCMAALTPLNMVLGHVLAETVEDYSRPDVSGFTRRLNEQNNKHAQVTKLQRASLKMD